MPMRKRMLPIDSRARSKKRMRPNRRKKTPEHVVRTHCTFYVMVRSQLILPPLQKATPTSVHQLSVKYPFRLTELPRSHCQTYSANRKAIVSAFLLMALSSRVTAKSNRQKSDRLNHVDAKKHETK
jgi:hypothetical protein